MILIQAPRLPEAALEAESEAGQLAIHKAVRLDCTYPHGKLSSSRGRGMGLGPCSSSSAYLCIHADKCFVKATVVREAIMFMLTTNGVGAPFVGRDNMIASRMCLYD